MIEQEIKLPVAGLEPLRDRLRAIGAELAHPPDFEDNWVLDDGDASLAVAGLLLRLRRWGSESMLTFKGRARFDGGVKTRVERETAVDRPDEMLAILEGIGMRPARRYQKRRELWRVDHVHVALDETPLGSFVELEGEASRLAPLARRLGLDPDNAVAGSYVALWDAYRASHPEAGPDMVFE